MNYCPNCGGALVVGADRCPRCAMPNAKGGTIAAVGLGLVTDTERTRTAGVLIVGAAAVIAVSSFLNWAKAIGIFGVGLSGTQVVYVLGVALVVGFVGIRVLQDEAALWVRVVLWLSVVVEAVTGVVALGMINSGDNLGLVGAGAGLYAFVVGSVATVIGAVLLQTTWVTRRRSSQAVRLSDDHRYWWDGNAWRSLAVALPPEAQRSPDGNYWWTGAAWEPVSKALPTAQPSSASSPSATAPSPPRVPGIAPASVQTTSSPPSPPPSPPALT